MPRRRWLFGIFALIVALLGLCETTGWSFVRGPLSRALGNGLARDVEFGERFELRLFGSVHLRSDSIRVGSPVGAPLLHDRQGQPQPFLDARDIALALPYSTVIALLRGERATPLHVRSLDVALLDLGLARRADGSANWQIGGAERPDGAAVLRIDRLAVGKGHLRLDDERSRLVLDATLQTHEGAAAATPDGTPAGGLEVSAVGSYRKSPLKARLRSIGLLPLAALADQRNTPTVPITLEIEVGSTRVQLDGRVADLLHFAALDAQVRLTGPSLASISDALGVTLPSTPPFSMQGRLRKDRTVWQADVAELAIGSSRLKGEFGYDPRPQTPLLTGRLAGARLSLPDLAPAFGAAAGSAAAAERTPTRLLPQRQFDIPSLRAMDADVTVRLDRVDLGTARLDTLAPLDGRVILRDSVLSIEQLVARASGGELRGNLSLDARQKLPRWQGDLRLSGVRLEQFVKPRNPRTDARRAAQPAAAAASEPGFISGVLGGRAKLQGTGNSTAAMLGSLDGSTELWVHNGRISDLLVQLAGLDLAEAFGVVMAGDKGLPMRCAVARLAIAGGVMRPEVAVLDTADTTLTATGSISLADERLALVVTARPHDMSPLAPRSPLRIEGSFAQPQVRLDAGKIGLRLAAAAALTAVAPLAALLSLADLGEPDRAVCEQALQLLHSPAAPKRPAPVKEK